MKKLLLIGSNSIHTVSYYYLIKDYFNEIVLITDRKDGPIDNFNPVIINFSIKNPLNINKSVKEIKEVIEDFNPDIIHVQQAGSEAWLTVKANESYGLPIIITALGSDVLHTPSKGMLYRKMLTKIINSADVLCCDSYYVANEMMQYSLNKNLNITIANFGIDSLGNSMDKKNIIYSNRLHEPLYQIDKILIAFSDFVKEQTDWELIIAGSGSKTSELKKLAKDMGIYDKVSFVGWVDKVKNYDLYKQSLIYVSFPASDATSISLLEAMSAGCIPVLSNLPANHEWVINDLNGIISLDITADSFKKALHLDRNSVKQLNQQIINQGATKDTNREKFYNIYDALLQT